MAYYEQIDGLKYRLCTNDPKSVKRKRIYKTVKVPEDIYKSERKTKLWLDRELALYVEKVESGQLIKTDKITLDQFYEMWKKGYAEQNMGKYTRYMTDNIYTIYIKPKFGDVRLDMIRPIHLVNFMVELVRKDGKPMATNSKLNIYKALKSLFDHAHKWKFVAENPMEGVGRPSAGKQEQRQMKKRKKAYSSTEVVDVITALYDLPERWRLYYLGVLLGGFRRGEMLAVQWPHADFEVYGVHIEMQITFDEKGDKAEDEVKTISSEGFVPMPVWYMDELKKYKIEWDEEKKLSKEWRGSGKKYIFHPGNGQMYYPNTPSLTWRRFLKGRDLPYIRLHDLRHTTATLLREYGADLKQIQERLRHSKLATTSDTYTHETELISRDAADRLERLNPKNQ